MEQSGRLKDEDQMRSWHGVMDHKKKSLKQGMRFDTDEKIKLSQDAFK